MTSKTGGLPNHPLPGVLFQNKSASWKDDYHRAAVDAHYNSERVYEYFLREHDRNSIDGKGMAIVSTVHYGKITTTHSGMENK